MSWMEGGVRDNGTRGAGLELIARSGFLEDAEVALDDRAVGF
jgi:hypothetical protein